jgi:hypothetical protein
VCAPNVIVADYRGEDSQPNVIVADYRGEELLVGGCR